MNTRNLTKQDETRWRELWAAYLAFYDVELAVEVTDGVWTRLLDEKDPLQGLACENEDHHIIGITHFFFHGTTWYPTSYCYLEDLYVDQTVRSKGAGRALIQGVKDRAKEHGAAKPLGRQIPQLKQVLLPPCGHRIGKGGQRVGNQGAILHFNKTLLSDPFFQ